MHLENASLSLIPSLYILHAVLRISELLNQLKAIVAGRETFMDQDERVVAQSASE
jgi:hypothetical protein